MKIRIYVCVLIALSGFSCLAIDRSVKAEKPPKTFSGTLEQYYPFEIELKGNEPVVVNVMSESKDAKKIPKFALSPETRVVRLNFKEIGTKAPMIIELSAPRYEVSYRIPFTKDNEKTVYVKIENGKILPREGSTGILGYGDKTPSGLSVKNNVTASQIKLSQPTKTETKKPTSQTGKEHNTSSALTKEPKLAADKDILDNFYKKILQEAASEQEPQGKGSLGYLLNHNEAALKKVKQYKEDSGVLGDKARAIITIIKNNKRYISSIAFNPDISDIILNLFT